MSNDENKELVRCFIDQVVTGRQIKAVEEYFVANSFLAGAMKNGVISLITEFPDLQITADDFLADGDKVIVRFTLSGTNTGPYMEHPPTGNSMTATGIHIYPYLSNPGWQDHNILAGIRLVFDNAATWIYSNFRSVVLQQMRIGKPQSSR